MIGSFWNLCRACPSMPIDKLHSEYRSTYRWHEYTGGSRPEVIKKPPSTNQFASSADHFFSKSTEEESRHVEGTINEPSMPRRKKCPELAYKTHEFINCEQTTIKNDLTASTINNNYINRARSGERGTPSRRSKSEGPHRIPNGQAYPIADTVDKANCVPDAGKAGESSGLFRKTISKLSTEYRIQFVWPHLHKDRKRADDEVDVPKKSLSMGAIKAAPIPAVHKKRTIHEKEATAQELEPLCSDEKPEKKDELIPKRTVRPFSHYATENKFKNAHTEKEDFGFVDESTNKIDNKTVMNGGHSAQFWYRDVVELRKKAEEYKNRGWGTEMNPELYKKQKDLWDQVSRRSSLSALSLASAVHKPITKEEKNAANNKKSSPIKAATKNASQINFFDNKFLHEGALPGRVLNIRHHLGRTTGLDIEEGALLPSPTRDKLMPTIPKSKEDESLSSQRGSPKKNAALRHGSPQKHSAQKKSVKQNRSQSVGPAPSAVDSSPKRQARSGSAAPASSTAATKAAKKTPASTPTIVERRPRPTTLSTSNHYRSKSSSLPPTGRAHSSTPGNNNQHQNLAPNDTTHPHKLLSPSTLTTDPSPCLRKSSKTISKHQRPQSAIVLSTGFDPMTASTIIFNEPLKNTGQDKKTAGNEDDTDKDGVTSLSSASPIPVHEIYEHIIKSPPEPTRVKSPEQIIMRSPDPVNWIVPLDTGKTFTVTQNVRNGDPVMRPQSEFKASTPGDKPPSGPLSAPPNVAEQAKMDAWKNEKLDESLLIKEQPHPTIITIVPETRYDKPVPGSTLRCLDDPNFNPEVNSPTAPGRIAATDDLDEARNRFDRFWGGNKDEKI